MKLGGIGTGMIVKKFLPELAAMEGIEIRGILSTQRSLGTAETLCETYGIPAAVSDFEKLCETGIDTVYVAVPNHLHFDYCRQALLKGLHVIVEKPMTSNDREAGELANLARERGLFLFEAISSLHLGSFERIRQWLPEIGTVKMVQSQFSQYSSRYDAFQKGEIQPVFDPAMSGGALMDLNLYNLHFVMGLFGKPRELVYYANVERGIDTSGILTMKYPGFAAVCGAAKDCHGLRGAVIQGTRGCIRTQEAASIIGEVQLQRNDGTTEVFSDEYSTMERYFIPEFADFERAIRENDQNYCYDLLEKSLAVSQVQTEARLSAGIRFPADDRA